MAIISTLLSILLPALGRARETSRRVVCGSNLRQIGTAFSQYTQENESWFPAKGKYDDGGASVADLALVQHLSSPNSVPWQDRWGPNFAGMIRDIVEKKATRNPTDADSATAPLSQPDNDAPQYIANPKVLLCPSDLANNKPRSNDPKQIRPTRSVNNFRELPCTVGQENNTKFSFISYFYISLWRNDDRPDWLMMADQSNRDDTTVGSFTYLDVEDNHGTRGINVMLLDTHVEWAPPRDGTRQAMQELAGKYWGGIVQVAARYPGTPAGQNRSREVQTIE